MQTSNRSDSTPLAHTAPKGTTATPPLLNSTNARPLRRTSRAVRPRRRTRKARSSNEQCWIRRWRPRARPCIAAALRSAAHSMHRYVCTPPAVKTACARSGRFGRRPSHCRKTGSPDAPPTHPATSPHRDHAPVTVTCGRSLRSDGDGPAGRLLTPAGGPLMFSAVR
jgi:hypothetical protein